MNTDLLRDARGRLNRLAGELMSPVEQGLWYSVGSLIDYLEKLKTLTPAAQEMTPGQWLEALSETPDPPSATEMRWLPPDPPATPQPACSNHPWSMQQPLQVPVEHCRMVGCKAIRIGNTVYYPEKD
jgi:hypothetical protein